MTAILWKKLKYSNQSDGFAVLPIAFLPFHLSFQMVILRSQTTVAEVSFPNVLRELGAAPGDNFRKIFNRVRAHYRDDISNIIAFWLDEKIDVITDRKIIMHLLDYAGLKHPLIRALLHTYDPETLKSIGVIMYTRTTPEGDTIKHYRFKAGDITGN
jgi:hypothetical protein